jgi:predicted DsbA family dithiol-disulfide isomerase
MLVEIWSDVMCPFCYIGKRKFETALEEFSGKDNVEIIWKSFQLNPNLKTDPGKNINDYLAEIKGCSLDTARQMNERVTQMAKDIGLIYDFEKAIVANSFDAHRLVQLAKTQNLGDAMEERLFKAYFTEGKNTAEYATLIELGVEIGLEESLIKDVLEGDAFAEDVHNDIVQAQQLGINGVPFFAIDRKFGISGAQESRIFLQALEKADAA